MAEEMWVLQPGDRFATMTAEGRAVIWQISDRGTPELRTEDFARASDRLSMMPEPRASRRPRRADRR